MGGTPAKMREGKVKKLPPPATEFSAPPRIAAMKRMRPDRNVMLLGQKLRHPHNRQRLGRLELARDLQSYLVSATRWPRACSFVLLQLSFQLLHSQGDLEHKHCNCAPL